jgi:hypothetical protein
VGLYLQFPKFCNVLSYGKEDITIYTERNNSNIVIAEAKGSTMLMPKPVIGHDPTEILFTPVSQ